MVGEVLAKPIEWNTGQGAWDTEKGLGSLGGSPSHNFQTPNEFGAQNFVIDHWLKPVA